MLLGRAGRQRRVLAQPHRLQWARAAAVLGDERLDLAVLLVFYLRRALGELALKLVRDAGDLVLGLGAVLAWTGVESPAESVGQEVGQDAFVHLRQGHDLLEQPARVQRPPYAVQALHAVEHDQVGVQLRVPGAGVPVVERGRDHSPDLLLHDAVRAGAGEERVPLGVGKRVLDRFLVRGVDD